MAKKIKLFRSITNITSGQLLSSVVFQQRGILEVDSKRKKNWMSVVYQHCWKTFKWLFVVNSSIHRFWLFVFYIDGNFVTSYYIYCLYLGRILRRLLFDEVVPIVGYLDASFLIRLVFHKTNIENKLIGKLKWYLRLLWNQGQRWDKLICQSLACLGVNFLCP